MFGALINGTHHPQLKSNLATIRAFLEDVGRWPSVCELVEAAPICDDRDETNPFWNHEVPRLNTRRQPAGLCLWKQALEI